MQRRTAMWILLGAFALRLAFGLAAGRIPGGDYSEYWRLAANLAHGHGFSLDSSMPYRATDWRLPLYPMLLVPVSWLHGGRVGVVVVNSVLGVVGVAGLLKIAVTVFPERPRLAVIAGAIAALFPPAVTYVSMGLTENVLLAAGPWFLYGALLWRGKRTIGWFALVFVTAGAVALTRAEDILVVLLALLLGCRFDRVGWKVTLAALTVAVLLPVAWAARNAHAVGRFELSDPMYRDAQLLMQATDGSQDSPLYLRGVALGHDGRSSAGARAAYQRQVFDLIEHTSVSTIAKFDVKNLANFPFVPPVWPWSFRHFNTSYTLGDSLRNLDFGNGLRVAWSFVLVSMYCAASIGLMRWWRVDRRRVVAIGLYPLVSILVAIVVVADPRQWLLPSFILILPAVEGAGAGARRLTRGLAGPLPS